MRTLKPKNHLLAEAVEHRDCSVGISFLQKLFSFWFDGFVYNQIWEDPRVDLEALQLGPDSRVLTIASGGCNVLNYLLAGPKSIIAIDLNQYHLYLTRLKLAALKHLPSYEDFLTFFGRAQDRRNIELYHLYISANLDDATRRFWEQGGWLRRRILQPRIYYFSKNLYNYSRSGYFLRFVHWLCRKNCCDLSQILKAQNQSEQEEFFSNYIAPLFQRWPVRTLARLPFILFSLGVPPQQLAALQQEHELDIISIFRDRVRRLACDFPLSDNYFAWQAFGRRYDCEQRQALPPYLKPDNYALLKERANRVETQIVSLTDYLRSQPANSLDRFVFLDAQDWMDSAQLDELYTELLRVGSTNSRLVFRTASDKSPLESLLATQLRTRLRYDHERSKELYKRDRSAIYGGFHLYELAA